MVSLLLAFTLFLPTLQTPASAPVLWPAGTRYALEMTKGRTDHEGGKLTRASETVTNLAVEVLESDAHGGVLRWTFGSTAVTKGADARAKAFAERMSSLNEGLKIDLRFDEAGRVTGLVDVEGVRKHYEALIEKMRAAFLEEGMPAATAERLLSQTRSTLLGSGFENTVLHEVRIFHQLRGHLLQPGVPLEYESELTNPLGGDPFPAVASLLLEKEPTPAGESVVTWTRTLHPEKARERVLEWMREMNKASGRPLDVDPAALPLKALAERARYEVDARDGLPNRLEWSRTNQIDQRKRVDWITIVRKPATPPAPPTPPPPIK